ncbi:hypothetical protein [Novosphingobium sp. 18052]|uniref:hypothetical protein n=1 Tax=Novosphingobium sp. 18052 TaxID=2681400 RepID=UPI00351B0DD8
MTEHVSDVMPRACLEAIHDPDYVEEVIACTYAAAKKRRIGFAINESIPRRSQLSPGGTWLAAKLAFWHGYTANSAGGSHLRWRIRGADTAFLTIWRSRRTG